MTLDVDLYSKPLPVCRFGIVPRSFHLVKRVLLSLLCNIIHPELGLDSLWV